MLTIWTPSRVEILMIIYLRIYWQTWEIFAAGNDNVIAPERSANFPSDGHPPVFPHFYHINRPEEI